MAAAAEEEEEELLALVNLDIICQKLLMVPSADFWGDGNSFGGIVLSDSVIE